MLRYRSVYILFSLVISCKSYDLKPNAQSVILIPNNTSLLQSIKAARTNSQSNFARCKFLGEVAFKGADSPEKTENDIKNQASDAGANTVFGQAYSDVYGGEMYACDGLDNIMLEQKQIDVKEEQQREIHVAAAEKEALEAIEKMEKELYSKPHHWLYCGVAGRSNMPPSVVLGMLKKFKLESYDSSAQCEDVVFFKNQISMQMGIGCICQFIEISRQKAEELNNRQ
jgi:hypothetical protein